MPQKQTLARARADKRQGKAAATQAGEFIKEDIAHVRKGLHGARSAKQAIAIGLSKARRAGVALPPPRSGKASAATRKRASRDYAVGHGAPKRAASRRRAQTALNALRHEGTEAASPSALTPGALRRTHEGGGAAFGGGSEGRPRALAPLVLKTALYRPDEVAHAQALQ